MHNINEIEELIKLISKLPGLGPKSAKRIVLKLINHRDELVKPMASTLAQVYKNVTRCNSCGSLKSNLNGCINCENLKEKYTKMYEVLEKVMLEKKNIHPNVDFPCGPTYYMMGIDIDFYTPIFVMSRITGWSAHIMEQHASNKLIRPLSKYKGKEVREVMLLNQR